MRSDADAGGGDAGGGDAGTCTPAVRTQCSQSGCNIDPACCACAICRLTVECSHVDLGGDGGDFCADPSHCTNPRCAGDPRCHAIGTEICNNCVDDNDNGLTDCADPQCVDFPGCQPGHMCPAVPDCSDPACACGPKCKDLKCHPSVDFGSIDPMDSSSTQLIDTKGTHDVATTPCGPAGGGQVVGEFTLTGRADVLLTYMQGQGEDHVFGLFRAGADQGCADNPVECYDPKTAPSGAHPFANLAPGNYYVIAQAYEPAGQGPITVTLSTETMKPCCTCGTPGLGGLVDCQNADCIDDPACQNQECKPDFNVGTLVVNAPGQTVSFDTQSVESGDNVTCEATKGGGDITVRFTLKETADVLLVWDQAGDHVIGLMTTPAPGEPCDFNQLTCYDPSARTQDSVAFPGLPPGDYLFIFKALQPGSEGHIDATISAVQQRKVTCSNPTECADPACAGVPACFVSYCIPDVNLGPMNPGDSQAVHLDITTKGISGYDNVSCARGAGGGKGMVVQLTIASVGMLGGAGIGFDCTQTGDQVIDLFAAGGPRDPCDVRVDEMACADPLTLPFGCGYEVPNLQAGTYDIVVEGYSPGSEGTMDLTLSIVDDRQLIDCRQPGACSNRQCITTQYCIGAQCKPDATIDPMPLDGSQVSRLVQTQGNGAHATIPCASTGGGQTAVILINLPAKADLSLQWNQIGNHDFVLYTDDGTNLPCDAGTVTGSCLKSSGASTGMSTFASVPQGRYYLVVGADAPDSTSGDMMPVQESGSVDVSLSGTPHP